MLFSRQVPHRTNLNQLFWNGLFQKKKPNRGGEGEILSERIFQVSAMKFCEKIFNTL